MEEAKERSSLSFHQIYETLCDLSLREDNKKNCRCRRLFRSPSWKDMKVIKENGDKVYPSCGQQLYALKKCTGNPCKRRTQFFCQKSKLIFAHLPRCLAKEKECDGRKDCDEQEDEHPDCRITKQTRLKTIEEKTNIRKTDWKLVKSNVCFGGKRASRGEFTLPFYIPPGGRIRLVYKSGFISCYGLYFTKFGGCSIFGLNGLSVFVTNSENVQLFPDEKYIDYYVNIFLSKKEAYHIRAAPSNSRSSYDAQSKDIILPGGAVGAEKGQKLLLWYGKALHNSEYKGTDSVHVCADVYAEKKDDWQLMQSNVCFGSTKTFGKMRLPFDIESGGIRLVYKSGGVTCNSQYTKTKFGCKWPKVSNKISLFVTDENNEKLFPNNGKVNGYYIGYYDLGSYDPDSSDITLPGDALKKGTSLRLWYGEALDAPRYSDNNSGETCVDVYGKELKSGFAPFVGNVLINDRPVCSVGWKNPNQVATNICKTLRYNKQVYNYSSSYTGIFVEREDFDGTLIESNDFIMNSVSCKDEHSNIGMCYHNTYNSACKTAADTAVVACIDSGAMQLKGGEWHEGEAHLNGYPFLTFLDKPDYNEKLARIVCSSVLQNRFQRDVGGVPMFSYEVLAERSTEIDTSHLHVLPTEITGREVVISDCDLSVVAKSAVQALRPLHVECAKCTGTKLAAIVDKIIYRGTRDEVANNAKAAKEELAKECHAWTDCSEDIPQYQEYCIVLAFLDDTVEMLESHKSKRVKSIQTNVETVKMIQHQFMEERFDSLWSKVDSLGVVITQQLGIYFGKIADFDNKQAKIDAIATRGIFDRANDEIKPLQEKLAGQLDNIFNFSIASVALTLASALAKLALAIANMWSLKTLTEGAAGGVKDIMDAADEVAVAVADVVSIASLGRTLKNLVAVSDEIRVNIEKNIVIFEYARSVLELNDDDLTLKHSIQKSKQFLIHYNNFDPGVRTSKMAEYGALVNELIDGCCEIIENPKSAAGGVATSAAIPTCQKVRVNIEIIMGLYSEMQERQEEIMDGFARYARSTIAAEAANDLKKSLSGLPTEQLKRQILKKKSMLLHRLHKKILIEQACNELTYMNHGRELETCKKLSQNPDLSVSELISTTRYKMCSKGISNEEVQKKWVRIPISRERKPGFLNVNDLFNDYKGGSRGVTVFTIPNKQWLLENKWIKPDQMNDASLFLKKFSLFMPPASRTEQNDVMIKVSFVQNRVGRNVYSINGGQIVTIRYTENKNTRCQNLQNNPYSVAACGNDKAYGKVCVESSGELSSGNLLPSIVGGKWKFEVFAMKPIPDMFPADGAYLYANVEFCSIVPRKSSVFNFGSHSVVEDHAKCCSNEGKFYSWKSDTCDTCPVGSKPRLLDNFCERCPAGQQPTESSTYGCLPCPVNTFKEDEGADKCESCPKGLVTYATGSTACKPKLPETAGK